MRVSPLALAVALAILPWSGALAEPQVLALLTTDSAKPLVCTGGECQAEFTSFCMEKPRSSPGHNTAYSLIAGADDVQVIAETAAGASVMVPAKYLKFASKRGFAAVRVSLGKEVLERFGAVRVAVKVGPRVVLRPVPGPDYRLPHEPEEIAAAIGPNRALGEKIVDRGGVQRETADLVSNLINALPENGKVTEARRRSLWRDAIAQSDAQAVSAAALGRARAGYERCLETIARYTSDNLAFCLGRLHDQQIWPLTQKYWRRSVGS